MDYCDGKLNQTEIWLFCSAPLSSSSVISFCGCSSSLLNVKPSKLLLLSDPFQAWRLNLDSKDCPMEPRRISRAVIDPKVRRVGFFTPNAPPQQPARTQSLPPDSSSPPLSDSPASNSLSPVMIPPPRHPSDNLSAYRTPAIPVAEPARERAELMVVAGSYDPAESLFGTSSPSRSPPVSRRFLDGEFSGESRFRRSHSAKFASSFPGGGFDLTAVKNVGTGDPAASAVMKKPAAVSGNSIYRFSIAQLLKIQYLSSNG